MNTSDQTPSPQQQTTHDPDEINLLEYAYAILRGKWFIIGATLLGLMAGIGAAIHKGPSYVCEAAIAPKETETPKTPNLSSFGAFGGIMASQLNMGGNASLDKISLLLSTRQFNADLVADNNLAPFIYEKTNPDYFKKWWDPAGQKWKDGFPAPNFIGLGGSVAGHIKKDTKSPDKPNTMVLRFESKDSAFSARMLGVYISYLNEYIKKSVGSEARENVDYLNSKMVEVSDPLIREKIINMIASEMEKSMMVSKEAFKIIDPPYSYVTFKQKKLYPMVFAAGLFFLSMMLVVFRHAFVSAPKSAEDQALIHKIQRELIRIPFRAE